MTSDGPQRNAPCVFPFIYKGKVFTECTKFEHDQFWCSTKVESRETKKHVAGHWGNCGVRKSGQSCPNGEKDR